MEEPVMCKSPCVARSQAARWTGKTDVASKVNWGQLANHFVCYDKEFCMHSLQLKGYFSGLGKAWNNTDLGIGEELVNLRDNG